MSQSIWLMKKETVETRETNKQLTSYAVLHLTIFPVKFATGGRSLSTGRHETGNSRGTRCTWLPCCRSSDLGCQNRSLRNAATEMEEMDWNSHDQFILIWNLAPFSCLRRGQASTQTPETADIASESAPRHTSCPSGFPPKKSQKHIRSRAAWRWHEYELNSLQSTCDSYDEEKWTCDFEHLGTQKWKYAPWSRSNSLRRWSPIEPGTRPNLETRNWQGSIWPLSCSTLMARPWKLHLALLDGARNNPKVSDITQRSLITSQHQSCFQELVRFWSWDLYRRSIEIRMQQRCKHAMPCHWILLRKQPVLCTNRPFTP